MRFWSKVQRRTEAECWPWTAATAEGYGRFKINGRLYSAHRIAYTLANGPIPKVDGYHGAVIMHGCDNPPCCNPGHLVLGTAALNAQDMAAKGRGAKPTAIAKVPPEIVREICEADESARALSKRLGLRPPVINEIRHINGVSTNIHRHRWQPKRAG